MRKEISDNADHRRGRPGGDDEALGRRGARLSWIRPLAVVAVVALGALATLPLEWADQAMLGALLFGGAVLTTKLFSSYSATLALMGLSVFATVRYLYWRLTATYDFLAFNDFQDGLLNLACVGLLLLAELYAIAILLLGYFQSLRPLARKPASMPADVSSWPSVDVSIPTYNEPLDVRKPTVLAALALDWPGDRVHVYILDDGSRTEIRDFAGACGVGYITRNDNSHAKAGNINNALRRTDGELIAIFDCDHVPTRSFLQMTVGWFLRDPRMAMVQTPHHFYSPDPFERNLDVFRDTPNEGALFYGIVQDGNDFWNATFFCGSCAVMRRTALEEVGGIAVETVTEDAHTALRMQAKGWNTSYIKVPQAAGLATASLRDHIRQRIRWARGMAQILRVDNPLLKRGLTLSQRLCYFNAALHFMHAGPRLIFLTAPLAFLLFGLTNFYGYFAAILAYALPHILLATLTNSRIQGQYRHTFWNEVYETVLAPFILLPTLLALINPRYGKFNVTPKQSLVESDRFDWGMAGPYCVLLALNVLGIATAALSTDVERAGALSMNAMWASYNVLILGVAIAVAWERRQRRRTFRLPVRAAVMVELDGVGVYNCDTLDLSLGGAAVSVPTAFRVEPGERVGFIFRLHDGTHRLAGKVEHTDLKSLRLSFPRMTLSDEQQLTRLIYSRADAWFDWDKGYQRDRPLRSLAQLTMLSIKGLLSLPRAVLQAIRQTEDADSGELRRQPALPMLAIGALALLTWFAVRGAAQTVPAEAAAAPAFEDVLDLEALGHKRPLTLEGVTGRAEVNFGVPITKVVSDAELLLRFTPAAVLDPNINALDISLNGMRVESLPTTGALRQGVRVTLPAELLLRDNTLTFEIRGDCGPTCVGASAASLRSELATATSVRLRGSMLSISSDFRLLPAPFFDRSTSSTLTLPFVFEQSPDAATLEAAGVAASWFGLLADHRGVRFPTSLREIPAGNVVVFARPGSEMARALELDGRIGPTVAIRTNPRDSHGKALVLLGQDAAAFRQAALALTLGQLPASGATADVSGVAEPAAKAAYDVPRWLKSASRTPLLTSSAPERLRVYGGGAVNAYFRLAPDLHFGNRKWVNLHLAYRYDGLGEDVRGRLKVHINGNEAASFQAAVAPAGEAASQQVRVPVEQLTFNNTLTVEFFFDRSDAARQADAYPVGQLLPETAIDLSGVSNFAQLPRLDLFANAGYPFTRHADLSSTVIALPERPTTEQVSLYLDLLGFFGAQTGHPAFRASVLLAGGGEGAGAGKDVLLIGAASDQAGPASAWSAAQVALAGQPFQVRAPGMWSGLLEALPGSRAGAERASLRALLGATDPPDAVMQGFALSGADGRNVVALTTADAVNVEPLGTLLTDLRRTHEIYGDVSVLSGGGFHSFRLAEASNPVGAGGARAAAEAWLQRRLPALAALIFALAALAAWGLRPWTDRRAFRRVQMEV